METLVSAQEGERYGFGRGRAHAAKVTQLTLKLWKLTAEEFGLGDGDRPPTGLAAGSILHDIGVSVVGKGGHHERSYLEILRASDLREVLGDEALQMAALVALHHRNKSGDPRTDPRVSDHWKREVARMAAILRIADALDRSLSQLVDDVGLRCVGGGAGGECELTVYYHLREPREELTKVAEKAELFESLFGVSIKPRAVYAELQN